MADVQIIDEYGKTSDYELRAGRDVSEFAYDRADVRPFVKHAKARVYRADAAGSLYVTSIPVGDLARVARVEVRWRPAVRHAALTIVKLSLIDDATGGAVPLSEISRLYGEPTHWRAVPNEDFDVVENRRSLPRAWVVARAVAASDEESVRAVERGRLENEIFDPKHTALVAHLPPGLSSNAHGSAAVRSVESDGRMSLDVECDVACLLVTSDAWYPGWRAVVDQVPAPIERVDLALRGVLVPAGRHSVVFRYAPDSLKLGLSITLLSIASVVIVSLTLPKAAQSL